MSVSRAAGRNARFWSRGVVENPPGQGGFISVIKTGADLEGVERGAHLP